MNLHPVIPFPTTDAAAGEDLRTRPSFATRQDWLDHLVDEADGRWIRWAVQGHAGDDWAARTDAKDLDLWVHEDDVDALRAALVASGAAPVARSAAPGRLTHETWWLAVAGRPARVDVTVGDLRVGPVLLVAGRDVTVAEQPGPVFGEARRRPLPRLTGAAAAADLFVRPLLRGRVVRGERLADARRQWAAASPVAQAGLVAALGAGIGAVLSASVRDVLDGDAPPTTMAKRARVRLAGASLRAGNRRSTWAERRSIAPSRRRSPLDLPAKGVLVALVGTDGSGKSTVAADLDERLGTLGFATHQAYFGMARGNLPGVATARRLLGVAPTSPADATPARDRAERNAHPSVAPTGRPALSLVTGGAPGAGDALTAPAGLTVATGLPPAPLPGDADTAHPRLRRLAAWYYAAEYALRYARHIAPARRRGEVVICDRYLYDLAFHPWPGSPAARLAWRVLPRPDVLVLPDAPDAVIHARKPERSLQAAAAQQGWFRRLVAFGPAGTAALRVDTSRPGATDLDPVVDAVLAAAHRALDTEGMAAEHLRRQPEATPATPSFAGGSAAGVDAWRLGA